MPSAYIKKYKNQKKQRKINATERNLFSSVNEKKFENKENRELKSILYGNGGDTSRWPNGTPTPAAQPSWWTGSAVFGCESTSRHGFGLSPNRA